MQDIKEKNSGDSYRIIKLIGEGSFGKCYLVEIKSTGKKCVIKEMNIEKMSSQERKETVQEARILSALDHPNIVRFMEVYKTKKKRMHIVMEFADGGDLQDRIKGQRGRHFSESQVLDWFTQMCLGLKHCHDRKILH